MFRQQLIDFTEFVDVANVRLLIAIWLINMIIASSFNKYSYGRYKSGYCFFSVRIPIIFNLVLFWFPYKRKVAIWTIVSQILTCITFAAYVVFYVSGLADSAKMINMIADTHKILFFVLLFLAIVDSMLHTDDRTGQAKDSFVSRYFKNRF